MELTQWHTARFIDSFDKILCKVCLDHWELDTRNNTKHHPQRRKFWQFGLVRTYVKQLSNEGNEKFFCSSDNINWADKIGTGIPFDMPGGDNHDNN